MTDTPDRLSELVALARKAWDAMTPEQRQKMMADQRRSYARAEAGFGSDADEAEYAAALLSGDPERLAAAKAAEDARLAAFDARWGNEP
jgi:hypothetical protein